MLDQEKIISALQGAGFRLTPLRRAMLDYLASTDEHMAACHQRVPKFIQARMMANWKRPIRFRATACPNCWDWLNISGRV